MSGAFGWGERGGQLGGGWGSAKTGGAHNKGEVELRLKNDIRCPVRVLLAASNGERDDAVVDARVRVAQNRALERRQQDVVRVEQAKADRLVRAALLLFLELLLELSFFLLERFLFLLEFGLGPGALRFFQRTMPISSTCR